MKAKSLHELINIVYNYILDENNKHCVGAIPTSKEFYPKLASTYELNINKIPELIEILKNSKMIFEFNIVYEDSDNDIESIKAFIAVKGDLLIELRKIYSDELVRLYVNEFSRKHSAEKIVNELLPNIEKYNNTEIGKTVNLIVNLQQYQANFENNIMDYAKHIQEKNLAVEIKKSKPLLYYFGSSKKVDTDKLFSKETTEEKSERKHEQAAEQQRRAVDLEHKHDFEHVNNPHSLKKTVEVYGIDFYSRICFREYKFNILKRIVDDNLIIEKEDLLVLKSRLDKLRTNSDNDMNIQKYANDINLLMKSINQKIKS